MMDSLAKPVVIRCPLWSIREVEMLAVAVTRLDLSVSELRRAAAASRDGRAARRMLAIALVLEGKSRAEAGQSCGMV
jgi:hypothetical protein